MKKSIQIICITLMFTLSLVAASYAAGEKIGIIDFQRILRESKAGNKAKKEIEKKGKSIEESLKKDGKEIEKLKKKLEAEALVMSKEKREDKEREFRIKINDFKSIQKKYAKDFKLFEAKIIKKIQKDVFELVQELGEKDGFGLILERGNALYYPEASDMTDRVIKAYDAK